MRFFPLIVLAVLGCEKTGANSSAVPLDSTTTAAEATIQNVDSAKTAAQPPAVVDSSVPYPASAALTALQRGETPVRALYINRFKAQGAQAMRHYIDIANTTEINALVIDIKDEFGLNYHSADPKLREIAGSNTKIANLKRLLDTLRANDILPIARIVVFKDSVAARVNPDHVMRQPNGKPWRDKQGLSWVNPYSKTIWEYNFRVAEEVVKLGFAEVQFDYIRFPEPYKSLPQQIFPDSRGIAKPDILAEFLSTAKQRFDKLGVRTTADIFGLVTTVQGALEIGQQWEKLSPAVDVVLPMVYPSHYPRGAFGIPVPNAEPYKVVHAAIQAAHRRDTKLGITTPEHVRPWLQAFTLGKPPYGAAEVKAQKEAVYDAGYDGWVLWHPGSNYDLFLPALEKTFTSRKKTPPATPPVE